MEHRDSVLAVLNGIHRLWEGMPETFEISLELPLDLALVVRQLQIELADGILSRDVFHIGPIVAHGVSDVADHVGALNLLSGQRTAILHVRQIEETVTVVRYLMKNKSRWEEFAWRWDNFCQIDKIKNRAQGLNPKPFPDDHRWYSRNLTDLRRYFDKTLTADFDNSIKHLGRLSNWLYPTTIKSMFDDIGAAASFSSTSYAWASHFTHFSPVDEHFLTLKSGGKTFVYRLEEIASRHVFFLMTQLLDAVARPIRLERLITAVLLHDYYRTVIHEPARFLRLHERREAWRSLPRHLASSEPDLNHVADILWRNSRALK
jgi:hypothetical protein